MAIPVPPDLSQRLGRAFNVGLATPAERIRVIEAAEAPNVDTFEDLAADVQALVLGMEKRPAPTLPHVYGPGDEDS